MAKVIPRKIAIAPIYSKYSSYPSHGLTPQRLAAIFKEADEGEVGRQMELFEEMEEHDPHLYSQLQTRKNAVTGLDWEIIPFSDNKKDKAVAEFIREQIRGIRNIEDIFLDLLDAIGKGISVSEISWKYDNGHTAVDKIEHVPPKLLRWDLEDNMRLVVEGEPLGITLPANKFIVHKYKAKSGHPSRAGILRVCAWMYLFKNYTIKDWSAFIEVFGLPLRLGKYATGASDDDKEALWQALVKMGTDAAGMVPEGTSIEFISTDAGKGASNGIYETMARYCDEQVSKAVLGQTLTADTGRYGSLAQSKTHNDVRHDLTLADCKALSATLRGDLIYPLVLFNFGPQAAARLPQIVFDCELPEDLKALVEILKSLVGIGVPIPLPYIYKKFSIPEPDAKEAVAKPFPSFPQSAYTLANKAESMPSQAYYQQKADAITETAMNKGFGLFEDILAPVFALMEQCGSLEELRDKLNDNDVAQWLLKACTQDAFTELLAGSMLAADLVGRAKADG